MIPVPIFFLYILSFLSLGGKEKVLDAQGPLCSPPQTWAALPMEFLRLWLGFLLPGGHKMYPSGKSMC